MTNKMTMTRKAADIVIPAMAPASKTLVTIKIKNITIYSSVEDVRMLHEP